MPTLETLAHRARQLEKSFKKRVKLFKRQAEGAKDSTKKSGKAQEPLDPVSLESLRRQAIEVADLEMTLGGWGASEPRALVMEGEVVAGPLSPGQLVALEAWLKRVVQMYQAAGEERRAERAGEVRREVRALLESWRKEELATARAGESILAFIERER
ncbi:hypothetical protein DL240_08880 [Lujinxingia litoralis]|uniref:Uncharacterized protein n=1 Tax=Lujinxingia litoralis TaxID=2211119 RepID=A0A328C8Q8_9DELT|nr:hypothetical protein [Lujinxingia litoralis]RAL22994.1 hypothetical protein DL240_08880 [Lujinxingia litoralis]